MLERLVLSRLSKIMLVSCIRRSTYQI